jgi:hypothetical protein
MGLCCSTYVVYCVCGQHITLICVCPVYGYHCVWFFVAVRMWFTVYVVSTLPPVVFVLYSTLLTFGLFIPITGRIGSDKNPELIIGIFAALLCLLLISSVVSMSCQ